MAEPWFTETPRAGRRGLALLLTGSLAGASASGDPEVLPPGETIERERPAELVHDAGARLAGDPASVRRQRAATRRTRTLLEAARLYLDPAGHRALAESLDALERATAPVCDLDVLLARVAREVRDLGEPDGASAARLLEQLERARLDAGRALAGVLGSEGHPDLLGRLDLPLRLSPGVARIPLARVARNELRRLAKEVARLGLDPDEAALRGLAVALERARYAAELSAPSGPRGRRLLADARILQRLLAEQRDAEAAEQLLRSTVVSSAETGAAFVAGRLAEQQRTRRRRTAAKLRRAWRRLRQSARRLC